MAQIGGPQIGGGLFGAGVDARPTYQEVEQALQDQGVPFRLTEFDSVV